MRRSFLFAAKELELGNTLRRESRPLTVAYAFSVTAGNLTRPSFASRSTASASSLTKPSSLTTSDTTSLRRGSWACTPSARFPSLTLCLVRTRLTRWLERTGVKHGKSREAIDELEKLLGMDLSSPLAKL